MGSVYFLPNAEEQVGTTLFTIDFVIWSITAVAKTVMFIIWCLCAYFNVNVIPVQNTSVVVQSGSKRKGTIEFASANKERSRSLSGSSPSNSRSVTPDPPASIQTDFGTVSKGTDIGQMSESEDHAKVESAIAAAASHKTMNESKQSKAARLFITLSIAMALCYSYYQVILHALRYLGIVTEIHCALVIPNIGWALNRLFLYLYFMLRLQCSFDGTFLQIKAIYYKILIGLYCVLMSIGVIFYYVYVTYVGCTSLGILVGFLPLSGFDSFCALICLYIFVKKLNKLVNLDRVAYNKDPKAMTELKYLVNKFLVISLFAIVFTYVVSGIFFIYPATCLAGVDTTVNVFCLLITNANYDFYYRMSCVLCRSCCEKSFTFANQLQNDGPRVIIH